MKPRLLYIINGFAQAGAERGLLTLVRKGFFADFDLHILALVQGDESLYNELATLIGADRVSYLRHGKAVSAFLLPLFTLGIVREFYRVRPQLAILSLPQSVVCGRVASLFSPPVKLIAFEHNVDRERRIANILLRLTSRRTDMVAGDAAVTLHAQKGYHNPTLPMIEIPLAILSPSPPRLWQKPKILHVLTLGRLVPQKNYHELLKGFALAANDKAELSFAGVGPLRNELEELAARLGIKDRVHFLGFVRETDTLLAQSHIYIQPSLREGMAISVLQGMAAGAIVIASDVGAIRDYGSDGKNMIKIAAPPVAENIAAALTKAFDAYASLEPMALAAQQTVQDHYSEEAVKQKWQTANNALHQLIKA